MNEENLGEFAKLINNSMSYIDKIICFFNKRHSEKIIFDCNLITDIINVSNDYLAQFKNSFNPYAFKSTICENFDVNKIVELESRIFNDSKLENLKKEFIAYFINFEKNFHFTWISTQGSNFKIMDYDNKVKPDLEKIFKHYMYIKNRFIKKYRHYYNLLNNENKIKFIV